MRKDTYFYSSGKILSALPVTVITGTCRSGKTLLGNALATCSNVEYADEPWTAMLLPMVVRAGKVDEDFAHGWLSAFVSELFSDLVLMRLANFRPNDLSSIWTKKTPGEILFRLTGLKTRLDVQEHVRVKSLSLMMTLAECGSFADVIGSALGNVRFVHVIRNGFQVAADVTAKGWYSDARLKHPLNAQLFTSFEHEGVEYHLPWFVDEGDERFFLGVSEYERGLYYWCSLIEKTLVIQEKVEMRVVKYDEFVTRPKQLFETLCEALGLIPGPLSDACITQIVPRIAAEPPTNIDRNLRERTNRINEYIGVHNG